MPPGAKKRKAAKKKQQQQEASSPQTNLIPTNHESREEDAVRVEKELGLDTDERIEITDSSRDHDKNASSSSSSSSSSSDDESSEVKKIDDDKETGESVSEVVNVSSVPNQPIPIAGDAPFMGTTANVIVESVGLMDSTTPSDANTEKMIEIKPADTMIPTKNDESSLPKPNEGETSTPLEPNNVPQGSKESEATISHEEEATVLPTHGVAQRTSWLSCCGLFDVVTGSSR
ncbi:unnamed protein product [Eruca vesicaria subsp. sativa]|uniref:Uncharacterized protein n=1 Tax=Eruca vesicaria subsp. sativa TaxID=29727 RepID=A0ABC8KLX1_ERUVS|nr:unnamed protein product [Eruca vesicaria subsp. sativa]